jgi:phospholipase C
LVPTPSDGSTLTPSGAPFRVRSVPDAAITRRTLLRGAAGAGAVAAVGGLPAWARVPLASAASVHKPDTLPFPHLPAGHESIKQIKHVVVLMMENHSFDNLLGMVPYRIPGRAKVDGWSRHGGRVTNFNPDAAGHKVYATRSATECQPPGEPSQSWDASHISWDGGHNNGFVLASGEQSMHYWDEPDIPFTYSLIRAGFPIGQRYFCSTLAQTYPNRRFLFAGTASGTIATNSQTLGIPAANGTIWDRFDEHHIDWADYYVTLPSPVIIPGTRTPARESRFRPYSSFAADVAAGKLPQYTLLEPDYGVSSEEDPQDIQYGEAFIHDVVRTLIHGPAWESTALFITYDEHGGYYDHVAPPRAISPDSIKPMTKPGDAAGGYDRLGFRVPLIVVSPWAKRGLTSNVVQDHTSLLAFVERKWNLPAMTYRDANADPMLGYFDLGKKAAFAKAPHLAAAPAIAPGLAKCHADGFLPPLPKKT